MTPYVLWVSIKSLVYATSFFTETDFDFRKSNIIALLPTHKS